MRREQDPWQQPASETNYLESDGAYDCLAPVVESMDGLDGSAVQSTVDPLEQLVSDLSNRKIDLKQFMK